MAKKKSLYEELGVEPTATKDQIKRAYRKKAAKLHPDVNKGPDAEQQFKRVCEAYMILYDDTARYRYDQTGNEEKPSDRKPVDIEEQAKIVLFRAVFSVVDRFGEQLNDHNMQVQLRKTLESIRKEVKSRIVNDKALWKAAKRKIKAVEKKQVSVERESLLYSILETKINTIKTQEILPCREKMKALLIDRATVKRALELVESQCRDVSIEKPVSQSDLMSAWDRAMQDTWASPTSTAW